ncbi:hypothetical protein PFISCL1PPCAC_19633, partial [Pristionchus fissidentatus]
QMSLSSFSSLFFFLLFLPSLLSSSSSCGSLRVHPSFRLSDNSIPLLSVYALDMEDCLSQCCAIDECRAVTMSGVVKDNDNAASCLLASCIDPRCTLMEAQSEESLITITIARNSSSSPLPTSPPPSSPSPPLISLSSSPPPLWIVAITIIIIFALFVLLIVSLIVCCWRRKRSSIPLKNLHSMPPLHAFNPTLA